jgi:hypothetical protein
MDNTSYNIRVPRRWARISAIVGVLALIVAPLTAVATHSFDDVSNDNTFHDDIEWLKAADVTRGCNPPDNNLFCPKDNVTREQMSAFMKRLAENQVVDADTVDGKDAAAFVEEGEANSVSAGMTTNEPGVAQVSSGVFVQLDTTVQDIDSITINAPASGFAIVTLTTEAWMHHQNGTTTELQIGVSASPSAFANGEDHDVQTPSTAPTGSYVHTLGITKAFPVDAGANTIYFLAQRVTGAGGNSQVGDYQISATYVASAYGTVEQAAVSSDDSDAE